MPSNMTEKVAFLEGEITGLQARIGGEGNAVQHHKLTMLRDIREDYAKSIEKARAEQGRAS